MRCGELPTVAELGWGEAVTNSWHKAALNWVTDHQAAEL